MADRESELMAELESIIEAEGGKLAEIKRIEQADIARIARKYGIPMDLADRAHTRYLFLLRKQPPSGGYTTPVSDVVKHGLIGYCVGMEVAIEQEQKRRAA